MTTSQLTNRFLCSTAIDTIQKSKAPDGSSGGYKPRKKSNPNFTALEPRIMFDAAMADSLEQVADASNDVIHDVVDPAHDQLLAALGAAPEAPVVEVLHATEIVFIDSAVADIDVLVADIGPNAEIYILDANSDGVEQMATILAGRTGIESLSIISHGRSGTLDLGGGKLTEVSIAGRHADEMAVIRASLSENADILLYGCDFAAGSRGRDAVQALANATGADVAASEDLTGAAELGGDWDLENQSGLIETRTLLAPEWRGILTPLIIATTAAPTVVGTGGVGTTAVWTAAGSVGGTIVDLRATVVTFTPGFVGATTPIFETVADNPSIRLTQLSTVVLKWEIFQTGTLIVAVGAPTWTVKDIDGIGGAPNTRESVAPDVDNLQSYVTESPTNVIITSNLGSIQAAGTQNQNSEPSSAVKFTWSDVSSWNITYRLWVNDPLIQARFEHDGDGDFAFTVPVTINLLDIDLDGNNNTAAGKAFVGTYVENGTGVQVVDTDLVITQAAAAGTDIDQVVIVLTNAQANDILDVGTLPAGISATINTGVAGQITVTLTGTSSVTNYTAAIHEITFRNSSNTPSTTARSLLVTATNSAFGISSNVAQSTINVTAVNDEPQGADATFTTNEDTPQTFTAASFGFSDPNDSPANAFQSVTITTLPLTGTLRLAGVPVLPGQVIPVGSIGTLTWTPPVNANGAGVASFTFQVTDNGGIANGGVATDQSPNTITFNVTAVNDPPVAVDDGPVTIAVGTTTNIAVLSNDPADPDGDTVTITAIIDPAFPLVNIPLTVGTAVTLASGVRVTLLANGTFDVKMPAGNKDTETFKYIISDGNGGTDTAVVSLARDTDGDGVANAIDIDDDNDGILDSVELRPGKLDLADFSGWVAGSKTGTVPMPNGGTVAINTVLSYSPGAYVAQGGFPKSTTAPELATAILQPEFVAEFPDGILGTTSGLTVWTATGAASPVTHSVSLDFTSTTAGVANEYTVFGISGIYPDFLTVYNAKVTITAIKADGTLETNYTGWNAVNPSAGYGGVDANGAILNTALESATATASGFVLDPANISTYTGNQDLVPVLIRLPADSAYKSIILTREKLGTGADNEYMTLYLGEHTLPPDTDADGIIDALDLDSDNDGISDLGESTGGTGDALADTNGDGTVTIAESIAAGATGDADGDGLMDVFDANTANITDAASLGNTPINTDGDSRSNQLDLDSDNDGIADTVEARLTAGYVANDGNVTNDDSDGDGVIDMFDTNIGFGGTFVAPVNTDGTDSPDYLDTNSDNDALLDSAESGLSSVTTDANGDGIRDSVGASYADPDGLVNNPQIHLANQFLTADEVGYRESNAPPTIDADGNNSSTATGADYITLFTENGAPVSVVDSDVLIVDATSPLLQGATVVVTGLLPTDTISVSGLPPGLAAITDTSVPGQITVDIVGAASAADYQLALQAIKFSVASENPSAVARYATITVNDGQYDSNVANITLNVLPVNDAPVIDLDGNNSTSSGANYLGTYTENGAPIKILDTDAALVDLDNTNLVSATVILTNAQANDIFTVGTLPAGITAVVTGTAPGVITIALAGSATVADYFSAINAVKFSNSSEAPDATQRVITVSVNDGSVASNTATSRINVVPVDDAPTVSVAPSYTTLEDTPQALTGISVGDPDAGTANVTVTLSVPNGTLDINTAVLGGITAGQITGDNSGTITITAPLSAINATLANANGLTYTPNLNYNGTDVINATINDLGNTGTGGPLSSAAMANIVVTPVNDAPVNTLPGGTFSLLEDVATPLTGISATDVDGNLASSQISVLHGALTVDLSGGATITGGANGSGTLTLSGTEAQINAALASISYLGNLNYNGPDALTIVSIDSAGTPLSDTDALPINVVPVNDAPVNTLPVAATVNEDVVTPLTGISATDVDGNLASTQISVLNGGLTVNLAGGATITAGANSSGTLTLSGTEAQINAALATISYLGNANYFGSDTLTVLSTDSDGTPLSDTDTVAIIVAPVDDQPLIDLNSAATVVDTTRNNAATFTEGDVAVLVALPAADVNDFGENDVTSLKIVIGTFVDGNSEIIRIAGLSFPGNTSSVQTVTVGGTTVQIAYNSGIGTFTITNNAGSSLPMAQADLDTLVQSITYENSSQNPTAANRTLTFTVTDAANNVSPPAVATINMVPVNDPPIATPSSSSGNEDTPIAVNLSGTDVDGTVDFVTVTTLPAPAQGVLYLADGVTPVVAGTPITAAQAVTLVFKPTLNFNGVVTVAFTVTDNSGVISTPANEVITVVAVNDPPIAVPTPVTGAEDAPVAVNLSGTDVDGTVDFITITTLPASTQGILYFADGVTPVLVNTPITAAQAATLVFKPTLNFNGTVNVPFTVTDNLGLVSTPATEVITITPVNDPPVATPSPISTLEDTPVTVPLLGTDVDGTVDFVTVTTLPLPAQGVLYLADGVTPIVAGIPITAAQGATLKFVPTAEFSGTVNIPYTVTDNSGITSTPATEVLTITTVNDVPLIDLNSAATTADTTRNNAVTFTEGDAPVKVALVSADVNDITENDIAAMKIVLGSALDGAAEIITIGGKSFPSHVSSTQTATVGGTSVQISYNVGTGTFTISNAAGGGLPIPQADLDLLVQGVTYANTSQNPTSGNRTLTFTATDTSNNTSPPAVATINMVPVNDPPTLANPPTDKSTSDGTAVSIATTGVFSDPEGATLSYSLALNAPTWLSINPTTGVITGTPPANASQGSNIGTPGAYDVTVIATDPQGAFTPATFQLDVSNVPPVANSDVGLIGEDAPLTLMGNIILDPGAGADHDTLPDADALHVAAVNGSPALVNTSVGGSIGGTFIVAADGTWYFDPGQDFQNLNTGQTRTTTVTYRVADGQGGTAETTITVIVNGSNDAPVSLGPVPPVNGVDGQPIPATDVGVKFSNPTALPLTFTTDGLPPGLTIDPTTGIITGSLPNDASVKGPYVVNVTATAPDGSTATMSVQINATNPPPTAINDAAQTPVSTPVVIAVLGNDTDPDLDALSVTSITPPAHGSVAINPDGTITYTPITGYVGPDTFTYTISDGQGGTSTATVNVHVGAPDLVTPTGTPLAPASGVDGLPITPINVLPNFVDPNGDPLIFTASDLPPGLTISPSGQITGTLPNDASTHGPYTVYVTATDPSGNQVTLPLVVTVSNPAPTAVDDGATTPVNTPVVISPASNDTDPDSDPLMVTAVGTPDHGTVVINPDGTVTYTPTTGYIGPDSFTYTVSDGQGGTDIATVNLTVGSTSPTDPAATPVPNQNVTDGAPVSINVPALGNVVDPNGDPLTYSAIGLPPGLTIDPTTGIISGTMPPDASVEGPYLIQVYATDPTGGQIGVPFLLTSANVAPAPVNDLTSTPVNQPININVLANDMDGGMDSDPLSVISTTAPGHGTVSINPVDYHLDLTQ